MLIFGTARAQTDSIVASRADSSEATHKTFLQRLIPTHATMQYAGSIGLGSVGVGYDLFKNKRGSLDFGYGYVPKSAGGDLNILSAKFAYRPFVINVGNHAIFYPANPGIFISYHLGKDFEFMHDSKQFPDNYYWWSTAMRLHLSLSNEFKINLPRPLLQGAVKSLSVYSEFNTNELYMISMFQNFGSLHLSDIVKIGFGIKIGF